MTGSSELQNLIVVRADADGQSVILEGRDWGGFAEEVQKSNKNLHRIQRQNFKFFADHGTSHLEVIAEFNNVSGELDKFTGWLQTALREDAFRGQKINYEDISYAEVFLIPVKTGDGMIYHFRGTLQWTTTNYPSIQGKVIPLSLVPHYGYPSGRIKELEPTPLGDSWIFKGAEIEYRTR